MYLEELPDQITRAYNWKTPKNAETLDILHSIWHNLEELSGKGIEGKSKQAKKLQREKATGCKPCRKIAR